MIAALISVVLTIAAAEPSAGANAAPPVTIVAAASDLQNAFAEVGKAFEAEGGGKVSFTFAASGVLAKQLKEGAPFDMFAAANSAFVDDVIQTGACDATTKALYARGHLVVWSKKNGRVKPAKDLADLNDARFVHIAIANPATAPYGAAAKEALVSAGVWEKISTRLVLGENARQTLQLAETGNADVAIVSLSLATASAGAWFDIDAKLHKPLDQALATCTRGANREGGDAFARFVLSAKGKAILAKYGFADPTHAPDAAAKP